MTRGGSLTTIDVSGGTDTHAYGINAAGQIVGNFHDATGEHGFLDTGGGFSTIDPPGLATDIEALSINAAGQIVGTFNSATGGHGFLYTGGSFTTIDVQQFPLLAFKSDTTR